MLPVQLVQMVRMLEADVKDNGNGTHTVTIKDGNGNTTTTIVKRRCNWCCWSKVIPVQLVLKAIPAKKGEDATAPASRGKWYDD